MISFGRIMVGTLAGRIVVVAIVLYLLIYFIVSVSVLLDAIDSLCRDK